MKNNQIHSIDNFQYQNKSYVHYEDEDTTNMDKENCVQNVEMTFDELMRNVGEFGWYQLFIIIASCLGITTESMYALSYVFVAGYQDYNCQMDDNINSLNTTYENKLILSYPADQDSSNSYAQCYAYVYNYTNISLNDAIKIINSSEYSNFTTEECNGGYTYDDSVFKNTIVSQWNLVCTNSWKVAWAYSAAGIGQIIGAIIWGPIIDEFGRKKPYVVAMLVMVGSGIILVFSPNLIFYCIFMTILAVNTTATFAIGITLAVEVSGISVRGHLGTAANYFWTIGSLLLVFFAYFIRNWSFLILAIDALAFILLIFLIFVPESPRWLYTRGHKDKGDRIMQKIAYYNKKEFPENIHVINQNEEIGGANFLNLFTIRPLLFFTLILIFIWFANAFMYYGISLLIPTLGSDIYLNFLISALIEVPGYLLAQLTINFFGRKKPVFIFMLIAGVSLLVTMAVPKDLSGVLIGLSLLGKLCITASWSVVICYTTELYPTVIRGKGFFFCTLVGDIGNVLAPQISRLEQISVYLPFIIFGSISIIAAFLSLLLPETRGQPLMDNLEDVKTRYKNNLIKFIHIY